ncbi:MAG TPA: SMP-30/gluconolactonase/LRE family protein [Streptosporangiaceae bacterium]
MPDGLTLDSEGCLWLAVFGSGELMRFTPDGHLDTVVRLPARQVTSATFGGPGLGTLYITTARENFTEADRRAEPHAGDIFACVPGTTGRPALRFAALCRRAERTSVGLAARRFLWVTGNSIRTTPK